MKINYPFRNVFAEFLSQTMTEGSVKNYLSYVNRCFSEFTRLTQVPLEYNDIVWLMEDHDCNFGMEDIMQYLKDNTACVLKPKYYSAFGSYIQFTSQTGMPATQTIPENVQKAIAAVGKAQTIIYSHDELLKNFALRLKTQNRVIPGSCYFPASLLSQIEPKFNKFIESECEKIGFIYEKNGVILKCQLKDVIELSLTKGTAPKWEIKVDGGQRFTLLTEVPSSVAAPDGLSFNGSVYEPMKASCLKKISIDHDPEISRLLRAAGSNGLLPRLAALTNTIDQLVSEGLNYQMKNGAVVTLPKAIKSAKSKHIKQQLSAVAQHCRQNGYTTDPKLMLDIEYLHRQMTLSLMDGKYNLNKNKGKKLKARVIMSVPDIIDYI